MILLNRSLACDHPLITLGALLFKQWSVSVEELSADTNGFVSSNLLVTQVMTYSASQWNERGQPLLL